MPVRRSGNDAIIGPCGPLDADVRLPGSKSQTQRALLCAALADGASTLRGALLADDTRVMMAGLERLGVASRIDEPAATVVVIGCGGLPRADGGETRIDGTQTNGAEVDCVEIDAGSAGTAMRFLTALAALGHGRFRIDGSPRMRQRPIGPLVDALAALGAPIGYDGRPGFPPVTMAARGLAGGQVRFAGLESSQFVSALLMVAPYAASDVFIEIAGPLPSSPYVNLTVEMMRQRGVEVLETGGRRFIVPATQRYRGGEYAIEPDASSAAYFWAAAAATGGRVCVAGLTRGSRQGDVNFVDVLEQMGCRVHASAEGIEVSGPASGRETGQTRGNGTGTPPGGMAAPARRELRGVSVDLGAMPDTVQTLAVLALLADGPTHIRNVANLRVKETDRLAALATELTRLGAGVEVHSDGLSIAPPDVVRPATIETYDDHRMAMSFAVLGLAVDGITVRDAGCVSKSFPAFFELLAAL